VQRKILGLGLLVALVAAVLAAAVPVGSGSAATTGQAVAGNFSLVLMVHQKSSTGPLPGVHPWDGRPKAGVTYAYRSIPCSGPAPVNNISSDLPSFNGRVRGSTLPNSTRAHPFTFRLRKVRGKWLMQGTLRITVCKLGPGATPQPDPIPDESKPKIDVALTASFQRYNGESLHWAGPFRLRGGTGRYRTLTGSGTASGYFTCLAGCAATSSSTYQDGQFTLQGTYRDSTPDLASG
jgi:hypothetical protein